jgi:hypothetical protein
MRNFSTGKQINQSALLCSRATLLTQPVRTHIESRGADYSTVLVAANLELVPVAMLKDL